MSEQHKAIAVVSGGMDSVTMAYWLAQTHDVDVVSVDYGQRHRKELEFAAKCAAALGGRHDIIDLRSVGALLSGSALTDPTVEVPEGHYADETMRATVVPNRNAILLSVATGIAVARGAFMVATAVHTGDHPIYPDCRPDFIRQFSKAMILGNDGFAKTTFRVAAPFAGWNKSDIVAEGDRLGVPFADTWSCYVGGELHCGRCGTCVERSEAFELANIPDPTEYQQ